MTPTGGISEIRRAPFMRQYRRKRQVFRSRLKTEPATRSFFWGPQARGVSECDHRLRNGKLALRIGLQTHRRMVRIVIRKGPPALLLDLSQEHGLDPACLQQIHIERHAPE